MALFTADAVVKLVPALPPGSPDTFTGAEEVRAWFEDLVAMNFEIHIEVLQMEGDTVTTRTSTWVDATREMGVAPLVATEVYTVQAGKIKGFTWTISDESLAKVQAAMAPPLEEAIIGIWEWDAAMELYLQFNADGTYRMHARPWPHEEGQTVREALALNPGDSGQYQLDGTQLTMTSDDRTVVCRAGDVLHLQIGITEDGKLEYAPQDEECITRKPPGKVEYFSRVLLTVTEPGAEWDLFFISDSSGFGAGELYAEYIERDLGVTVRLHDLALGNLSAGRVLRALGGETEYHAVLQKLSTLVREADVAVVVFYANPLDSISETHPGDWNCVTPPYYVDDCSPETFEQYRADLDAIYEEILTLRSDAPIIIRAFDAYNPIYSLYRESGVYDECVRCWENYNEAIHQAAAARNVPIAHVYDAFNGPNHDEDPRDKGYIGPDGEHTSETGRKTIADLLWELGYEPLSP